MSTATVAAKGTEGQGESMREEKRKTKGGEGSNEHCNCRSEGNGGADIILIIYIIGRRVIVICFGISDEMRRKLFEEVNKKGLTRATLRYLSVLLIFTLAFGFVAKCFR